MYIKGIEQTSQYEKYLRSRLYNTRKHVNEKYRYNYCCQWHRLLNACIKYLMFDTDESLLDTIITLPIPVQRENYNQVLLSMIYNLSLFEMDWYLEGFFGPLHMYHYIHQGWRGVNSIGLYIWMLFYEWKVEHFFFVHMGLSITSAPESTAKT